MQETLPHAVQRMRQQGFNDHQIAGQIHHWHSGWTAAQVAAVLGPQPAHVTKAKPTYHGTSTKPFYTGQKPDHYVGSRSGGGTSGIPVYVLGKKQPSPAALTTALGAPATGQSEERSQASLARIYRQNHPLGQQLIQGVADSLPGVALAKGLANNNVGLGTVGSEAFNDVTSGLVPVGKAAALFGGFRALRRARTAVTAAEDVGKTAKAAEAVTGAAKGLDPLEGPVVTKAKGTTIPDEAAQLRPVLSGKAGTDVSARRAYKAEAELRSAERSARLTKANEHLANRNLEPEERIRLWKDEMRGELPKIQWRGFDELSPDAVRAMTRYAMDEAPHLLGTQRVRVVGALENAVNGVVPRPHELKLLEHVFGTDTAQGFQQLAVHPVREAIIGALNIPRTLMASLDFSAPLRQGLVALLRHPATAAKSFPSMFKAFASEKSFQALGATVKASPNYPLYVESGLPLTGLSHGLGDSEEAFLGASMAEKFTGGKRFSPVRMSDRAYTGFLIKLRTDVFDLLIRQAQSQGLDVHDEKFLHDLGHFIGNATGRGTFDHQALEQAMPLLNLGFFSPRLIASRMQLINPVYYLRPTRFGGLDPFVRREALKAALATYGSIMTVLGLAAAAGAKVGRDPRSADFGKIRIGATRIDIAGGFQPYFHLLGELLTGERISSTTGQRSSLYHPTYGQQSAFDAIINFGRNKASPLVSIAADKFAGSSGVGQPFSTYAELKKSFFPLILQDMTALRKQPFHGMNGIEAALLGYGIETFGTGLQTYTPQPAKGTGGPSDPLEGGAGISGGDPLENPGP